MKEHRDQEQLLRKLWLLFCNPPDQGFLTLEFMSICKSTPCMLTHMWLSLENESALIIVSK